MKRVSRILLILACVGLLSISWVVALTAETGAEKQAVLIGQAGALMEDKIYVNAVPLLIEAAGLGGERAAEAEVLLKQAYIALIETQSYRRDYVNLLDVQMQRPDADAAVFEEAALYYMGISRLQNALTILKDGIAKTGSDDLAMMYHKNRYAYAVGRTKYEDVTAIYGGTIQVQVEGAWGLASSEGNLILPCEYEKISTFSGDRAVVEKDGEVYAVNRNNLRVAYLHTPIQGFGNLANGRIPLLVEDGWKRADGGFMLGSVAFEEIGMYAQGYVCAKRDGKWGVVDLTSEWLVQPNYDEIMTDELGRCYAQGAVFARSGDEVRMIVGGVELPEAYQEARPFEDGYAAVKRGGKWGFVDTTGTVVIECQFDDALSFGQHLAAVKIDGLWGYIATSGGVVIEPAFLCAKSFSAGSAPVLTEDGWQFITLLEYRKAVGL